MMIKVLFDLKKEYYFNSLYPMYLELSKDPKYDIYFHVGKDHKRWLGIFLISQTKEIETKLKKQGLKITSETNGFDLVICGDVLKNPEKYGDCVRVHLDHGVGTKTLRIRNIKKQPDYHYHVFLEGQYWYDYIKSLGWENTADFYITGIPKLDPLFWKKYYKPDELRKKLGLDKSKKTVLFAPSYKPSCISFVQSKITQLLPKYNLIIKLHPYSWGGKYAPHSQHRFYEKLAAQNPDVFLIGKEDFDIYPYLVLADTIISDTSSVINEFLALGKHGIIYVLPMSKLKHSDGMESVSVNPSEWLKGAFSHMFQPEDLLPAVEKALNPTDEMKQKLQEYRDYFFTDLDGNASVRVKAKIDELMERI
ncbi:MAG: CDP-glycerol glycerophosphotransferase family protein [Candidatus Cloacimonetes bacterium]|nr:CDP-glycerol glycerophosphotransferase family protein [Candidatus Cloacimonadota bacterium]MCF7815084.1 CDP-glycerol glycerophosphotransferase family protein [Candidatus Cloacimonadota bacterium]MCF7868565.1 CDP-glycerol glycerophosphotransferase family protein [Candidatus Cloacimonadota bacterium]MCF7884277.1 CDP-glycerol glycerophosphotransferase family protein [Candidatus Cloacimonadota bacterium]